MVFTWLTAALNKHVQFFDERAECVVETAEMAGADTATASGHGGWGTGKGEGRCGASGYGKGDGRRRVSFIVCEPKHLLQIRPFIASTNPPECTSH